MNISPNSRYYDCPTIHIEENQGIMKESFAIKLSLPQPPHPDSILHIVTQGETLDMLAWKYYKNDRLWWKIVDVNIREISKEQSSSTYLPFQFLQLKAGQKLWIPPISQATLVLRRREF